MENHVCLRVKFWRVGFDVSCDSVTSLILSFTSKVLAPRRAIWRRHLRSLRLAMFRREDSQTFYPRRNTVIEGSTGSTVSHEDYLLVSRPGPRHAQHIVLPRTSFARVCRIRLPRLVHQRFRITFSPCFPVRLLSLCPLPLFFRQ